MTSFLPTKPELLFGAADAIVMGGVYSVRSLVKKQKLPHIHNVIVISGAELAYNYTVRNKLNSWLSTMTGEQMFSALAGNVLGMTGALYALAVLNLQIKNDEGRNYNTDDDGKPLKESSTKRLKKSAMLAVELVLEKGAVEYFTGLTDLVQTKVGSNLPVPAQT